ncbi:MAG: arylsulfatase [Acidobacteria bacterium]|nr:arylsulfatase [Acidobacteriota bacterium]
MTTKTTIKRRQFLPLLAAAAAPGAQTTTRRARPNILLILADDLGYSDLGCFGGEIETPNLNRLAMRGIRFTQFYNNARCCPSRAALMTGQHPHKVGMGNMTGGKPRPGFPGYTGRVDEAAPCVPAVLKQAGYTTLMCGKWHLGQPGPVARGFDEFFGMVHGFDSFWDASKYTRRPVGRPMRRYDGRFHATEAITDHALDFLSSARAASPSKPWFLYLAYNAPHFPLHAPKELIDKYQPVYEKGWDVLRSERFARLGKLGLLGTGDRLTPRSVVGPNRVSTPNGWAPKQNPPWDSLPEDRRRDLARRMAIFAAMVEQMDRNIGRVLEDLETKREIDNTLILFASDNGACAEWDPFGFDRSSGPENILHTSAEQLAGMGQPGTYHSYGSAWANMCNTPWRLYKHYTYEGGISTPCIVQWPARIGKKPRIDHRPWHFIDVLPTLASLAGAAQVPAGIAGESMATAITGGRMVARGPIFWEHEGSRAVRDGKWKLTAVYPQGAWELYDIEADRSELHNRAADDPARVRRMAALWEQWARANNVLPWIWEPAYGEG